MAGEHSKVSTKIETDALTANDLVQFKMEPYESGEIASDAAEVHEETFEVEEGGGDDAAGQDETEDFSLLEGMEGEPQAGTSGDAAGEGQGRFVGFRCGGCGMYNCDMGFVVRLGEVWFSRKTLLI